MSISAVGGSPHQAGATHQAGKADGPHASAPPPPPPPKSDRDGDVDGPGSAGSKGLLDLKA